jgi:Glycosyltransferase family 87
MTIPAATATGGSRRTPWSRWNVTDTKTLVLCCVLGTVCGFIWVLYAQGIIGAFGSNDSEAHGDFFALWSYGKIAAAHPATDLYNFATLHARQVALGMRPADENPFPYPPIAILLFSALSLGSYHVAYALWVSITFALFLWVIVATCWRTPGIVLPVVIAPLTMVTAYYGQSGFLAGSLLIGGLRLAAERPVISGILLGLLSYKPQLAVLVPVALIAAGLWRPLAVASVTAIVLAAVATVSFGWRVWPAWLHLLPIYSHWFAHLRMILRNMPTVQANLRMLGVSANVADAMQTVSCVAMAIVVWRCFRRGPSEQATAALLVATFLSTPHALIYDATMLTGALVLFVGARVRAQGSFSLAEIVVLVLAVLFPFILALKICAVPTSSAVLLLWLIVIIADESALPQPKRRAGSALWSWQVATGRAGPTRA